MIIYFAGRIMAWLYGYAWPLMNSDAKAILATMSVVEMAVELPLVMGVLVDFSVDRVKGWLK